MAKDARTEFFYFINGKPYRLAAGRDGVTEEILTVLRDSYHAEHLNDRYEDELQDPGFKFAKTLHETNQGTHATDPVDNLEDCSHSPEQIFFREELSPSIRDRVHTLIPRLIPAQQELYWKLCEGRQLVDIAREEGTTDNAIRSRRRKMMERLRALYAQEYGDA
jgi:DNA-binding CsgD family transcriptional regulator